MLFSKTRSIRWNFSVFAGLVIALLAVFIAWFSVKTYRAHVSSIVSVLESQAGRLDRSFSDDIDYTSYVMQYMTHKIAGHEHDLEYIADILSSFTIEPKQGAILAWSGFSWANAEHQIVATGIYGKVKDFPNLATRDYIPRTVAQPGVLQIGGVTVTGAVSGQNSIPVGMGGVNLKGKFSGTVVTGFSIDRITYKLEQALSVPGVSFAIFDQQKNLIAESSNNRKILGEDFTAFLSQMQRLSLVGRENGLLSRPSFGEEGNFSYYFSAPKYPYFFILNYDKELSSSMFWHTVYSYVSEFIVILALVMVSLFFLKWRIIRPITDLSLAADEIAKGNTKVSPPSSMIHEVNNLSQHLSKIAHYVEDLKQMQEELQVKTRMAESAGRAKADFLALMSHELRTPLNAIIGYSDIQKRRAYGPENPKYHEYSQDIYNAGVHLLNIINDIIDVTRSENANFRMNKEEVDVQQAIVESVQEFAGSAAEKNIRIICDVQDDLPRLMVDGRRFRQMLSNLLSNAVKFTERNGTVSVRAHIEDGASFAITIRDTGIGMKQEDIIKALQVFDQVDTGFSRKFQGLGLGLPLTKRLVEMHEGTLEIETELGKGLTAVLRFPLERAVYYPLKFAAEAPASASRLEDTAVVA